MFFIYSECSVLLLLHFGMIYISNLLISEGYFHYKLTTDIIYLKHNFGMLNGRILIVHSKHYQIKQVTLSLWNCISKMYLKIS